MVKIEMNLEENVWRKCAYGNKTFHVTWDICELLINHSCICVIQVDIDKEYTRIYFMHMCYTSRH